jgi:Rrf2 family protein
MRTYTVLIICIQAMLNKTSLSAIRALLFLAQQAPDSFWSPRRLAEVLGESPTYLAKVVRLLVKCGILEAERGVKGGVRLRLQPEEITLLAVVEACQGTIVGDYCRSSRPASSLCSFHLAALELHEAITGVLGRWTLAGLLARPAGCGEQAGGVTCLVARAMNTAPPRTAVAAAPLTRLGSGA